jgi:hypothetical protein
MIEYEGTPKYFTPDMQKAALGFPEEIRDEVTSQTEPIVSAFHFIDDLGKVSADNFSFTTTLRNTFDDRWAVCQTTYLYFIGTSGALIIPFSKIGCSSDNNLMLNDKFIRGKETDLSALSADFTEPVELSILVEDQSVTIFRGEQQIYSNQYLTPMGDLVGLRFKFVGLGEVLDYTILDQAGNTVAL